MSVAGITSISPLQGQDHPSQQRESVFDSTGEKLQALQLESAKQAADSLDTLNLSGLDQQQRLVSEVRTLNRDLQAGDASAAQAAYQALREDLDRDPNQSPAPGAKAPRGGVGAAPGPSGGKRPGSSGGTAASQGAKTLDVTG